MATKKTYPFALPELKFDFSDLEPYMDEKTVDIHYHKHHQGYVDKTNKALDKYPEYQKMTIQELMRKLEELPMPLRKIIRQQGGGHANHELFWQILKPGPGSKPSGELATAINKFFDSFDAMKKIFNSEVTKLFGSGWVFLALNNDEIVIEPTRNHDSVITFGMSPLMICDVWEHAYYLKHQNRKDEYMEDFWNLVDWQIVEKRFDIFKKNQPGAEVTQATPI